VPVQNYTNHVMKSAITARYGLCGDIRTGEIEAIKKKTSRISVRYKKTQKK
jgi:hypothetical protein